MSRTSPEPFDPSDPTNEWASENPRPRSQLDAARTKAREEREARMAAQYQEREARIQGHDPEWVADQKWFFAALTECGHSGRYELLKKELAKVGTQKPSNLTHGWRTRIIDLLSEGLSLPDCAAQIARDWQAGRNPPVSTRNLSLARILRDEQLGYGLALLRAA